ncbi:MAG: hypothetical protein CM1200mP29_00840 [Verrucomicrobiota bacterium]|nr:MAG: hypothetical protein CM1200mP29_00840 [Verrucomicrobiota bacterium]
MSTAIEFGFYQLDELFVLVSRGGIRLDRTEIDSRFKSGWHTDLACVKLRNNKHISLFKVSLSPWIASTFRPVLRLPFLSETSNLM